RIQAVLLLRAAVGPRVTSKKCGRASPLSFAPLCWHGGRSSQYCPPRSNAMHLFDGFLQYFRRLSCTRCSRTTSLPRRLILGKGPDPTTVDACVSPLKLDESDSIEARNNEPSRESPASGMAGRGRRHGRQPSPGHPLRVECVEG